MSVTETASGAGVQRKTDLQTILVAVAAVLFAGVLYVGDTTLDKVASALPAIPLTLPILVVVGLLMVFGTPVQQRQQRLGALKGAGDVKRWPMAVWALVAFLVWLVWMMLSGLWAPEAAEVAPVVVALLTLGIIACVSAALFYLHPEALVWLWASITICSTIFLYGGIVGPKYVGRMTAFGGGPNVFARFMMYGIAAAVFFMLWRKYLWVVLILAAPFAYGLIASGSRGVLVATAVVLLFTAIAVFVHWGWKWATAFYVAVAAAVAYGYSRFVAGTEIEEYFKTRFIDLTFEKGHDSGRGLLHSEASRIMSEHRVFGAGLHSFVVLADSETTRPLEHPHNIFYTVGAEGGVIGIGLLAIALIALAIACRYLFKFLQGGLTAAVAFAVLVAQLFSGYYYDSRPLWLFGFAAAFAMLSLHRRVRSTAQPETTTDTETITEVHVEPVAETETESGTEAQSELEAEIPAATEPEDAEPATEPEPEPAPEPELVTDAEEPVVLESEPTVGVVKQNAPDNKKLRVATAALAVAGAAGAIGWLVKNRPNAEVDARAEEFLREVFNEK